MKFAPQKFRAVAVEAVKINCARLLHLRRVINLCGLVSRFGGLIGSFGDRILRGIVSRFGVVSRFGGVVGRLSVGLRDDFYAIDFSFRVGQSPHLQHIFNRRDEKRVRIHFLERGGECADEFAVDVNGAAAHALEDAARAPNQIARRLRHNDAFGAFAFVGHG